MQTQSNIKGPPSDIAEAARGSRPFKKYNVNASLTTVTTVWPVLFEMSGKAEATAKTVAQGQKKQVKKIRHIVKFGRQIPAPTPKQPIYDHKAVKPVSLKRNDYKIIKGPVTSDKASSKIENENTLVFWVDLRATKTEIASAVQRLYHVKPVKVSTLISSKCLKKAYVRLPEDVEAINLANEIA